MDWQPLGVPSPLVVAGDIKIRRGVAYGAQERQVLDVYVPATKK